MAISVTLSCEWLNEMLSLGDEVPIKLVETASSDQPSIKRKKNQRLHSDAVNRAREPHRSLNEERMITPLTPSDHLGIILPCSINEK
jgi:hypothetical protein